MDRPFLFSRRGGAGGSTLIVFIFILIFIIKGEGKMHTPLRKCVFLTDKDEDEDEDDEDRERRPPSIVSTGVPAPPRHSFRNPEYAFSLRAALGAGKKPSTGNNE